jgi:hypothetical protein
MSANRSEALWQGLIAGLIGYAVFAAYFLILNVVSGRPALHTVGSLGSALFGIGDPASATPDVAAALAYNALHLIASVFMGSIASFLLLQLEKLPAAWYVIMFLFVAGLLYSMAVGGIVAREIVGVVTWPHVIIVNLLAAFLAGQYLWRSHPRLAERVRRAAD